MQIHTVYAKTKPQDRDASMATAKVQSQVLHTKAHHLPKQIARMDTLFRRGYKDSLLHCSLTSHTPAHMGTKDAKP